jgi:hypothetical protein
MTSHGTAWQPPASVEKKLVRGGSAEAQKVAVRNGASIHVGAPFFILPRGQALNAPDKCPGWERGI